MRLIVLVILLVSVTTMDHAHAGSERATIAVASNFRMTLEQLLTQYQIEAPQFTYQIVSGSTGVLASQIRNGAPFDLFFAADAARPEQLGRDGLGIRGSVETYAQGQIAIWMPHRAQPWQALMSQFQGTLAIANPALAPYGLAAQHLLNAGLFQSQPKVVRGANVHQAFQFVDSGNAEAAMTSHAQVIQARLPRREYYLPAQTDYPPIVQKYILLSKNTAAKALLVYLATAPAQRLIEAAGYTVPEPKKWLERPS